MSKGKLEKFEELNTFPHVLQNRKPNEGEKDTTYIPILINNKGEEVEYKGKWSKTFFGNSNPLVLELACGRGEYSVAMGKEYPEKNFIGVDIKGNRIWKGARMAMDEEMKNVGFIRTRIEQIDRLFDEDEVSEIWITFPDPFLRKSKARKRLTHSRYLKMYKSILASGGVVHLKTDSDPLYQFTKESIEEFGATKLKDIDDIYKKGFDEPLLNIKTYYENMHLEDGRTIKYLKMGFNSN